MSNATLQKIKLQSHSSIKAFHLALGNQRLGSFWHFHPEFEIVYLPHGSGRRFVGSQTGRFEDGDLVLLGANIPHNCFNVGFESNNFEEYVIQFKGEALLPLADAYPEFQEIRNLLERAKTGLAISGSRKHQIGEAIKKLVDLPPFEKLLQLFRVLQLMTDAPVNDLQARQYLSISPTHLERIQQIYDLIQQRFREPLSTRMVAQSLYMTESAFCRFLVKATGKTFKQTLNEVRIQQACNLLINTNQTVSSIAFDCGFNSLSFFNRFFKKTIGETPLQYRQSNLREIQVS